MREFTGVILVRKDGAVLSQLRDNKPNILSPNLWAIIGGVKEPEDDSLEASAKREFFEETGYAIHELTLLGKSEFINARGEPVHATFYWAPYDEEKEIHCYEGQEVRFLTHDELNSFRFFNEHKPFLVQATLLRSSSQLEK